MIPFPSLRAQVLCDLPRGLCAGRAPQGPALRRDARLPLALPAALATDESELPHVRRPGRPVSPARRFPSSQGSCGCVLGCSWSESGLSELFWVVRRRFRSWRDAVRIPQACDGKTQGRSQTPECFGCFKNARRPRSSRRGAFSCITSSSCFSM